MLVVGVLVVLSVGVVVVVALVVGARRDPRWVRPALIGMLIGGVLAMVGMVALGTLRDLGGWGITPEGVQLAAVNALLDERPLGPGTEIRAKVHFGGESCGGVVELWTPASSSVFVVGHDSGDPMASRFEGTVAEAIDEVRSRGYECPDF